MENSDSVVISPLSDGNAFLQIWDISFIPFSPFCIDVTILYILDLFLDAKIFLITCMLSR